MVSVIGAVTGFVLCAAASVCIGLAASMNETSCDGGLCGIWMFAGLIAAIPVGLVGALFGWGIAALAQRDKPAAPVPPPSSHWHG